MCVFFTRVPVAACALCGGRWKVCGSASASSEAATGGRRGRGVEEEMLGVRNDTHILRWRVLSCAPSRCLADSLAAEGRA